MLIDLCISHRQTFLHVDFLRKYLVMALLDAYVFNWLTFTEQICEVESQNLWNIAAVLTVHFHIRMKA